MRLFLEIGDPERDRAKAGLRDPLGTSGLWYLTVLAACRAGGLNGCGDWLAPEGIRPSAWESKDVKLQKQ